MAGASTSTAGVAATREAYGQALADLGASNPNIVVVDADLSGSTKTNIFAKAFPERFFNVGVAEQNLMGVASGLAHSGKKVFVSTFTMFAAGRAWEIVRQSIAYPHMDVKICSTHAGITVGEDGASHQIIEDIALMRVIPGMKVFVPADAPQTKSMMNFLARDKGPAFVRLGRAAAAADVFDSSYKFELGKGSVLREGNDACLFVTGFPTRAAVDAAQLLSTQGISISVVNLGSVKPIDAELITAMSKKHKVLLSLEEHSVIGGLGGAVAEVVCEHAPNKLVRLGMQDEFGQSAPANVLLKHYKMDAAGVAEQVTRVIKTGSRL